MELRFDGQIAIVTGAGRGIGRAHAQLLARRGAAVVVNDLGGSSDGGGRDQRVAEEAASEILDGGGTALPDSNDVSDEAGARALVDRALETFGRVDVVVNNAGIFLPDQFPDSDFSNVRRHVDVHVGGSFNVTRAAWPQMRRRGYGRIVMTTSTAILGAPDYLSYTVAKAGVLALGRGLAVAGRQLGIKVNNVAPLATTRLTPGAGTPPGDADDAAAAPELVSALVAILCHSTCPVSGETFMSGMGRHARIVLSESEGHVHADGEVTPESILSTWDAITDLSQQSAFSDTHAWKLGNDQRIGERRGIRR